MPPDRISFADTLAWLRQAGPDEELPPMVVVPVRPGRLEPRVVKRRPKPYPLMQRPRDELRKLLLAKRNRD